MTKKEFFKYCDTRDRGPKMPELSIWVGNIHREREYAVFLCGSWHRSSITQIQLYQPTPGRQWELGKYVKAREACDKAAAKFNRWLDDWKLYDQMRGNNVG